MHFIELFYLVQTLCLSHERSIAYSCGFDAMLYWVFHVRVAKIYKMLLIKKKRKKSQIIENTNYTDWQVINLKYV